MQIKEERAYEGEDWTDGDRWAGLLSFSGKMIEGMQYEMEFRVEKVGHGKPMR